MVKFSIIIPIKSINDYVRETVRHIQFLNNKSWEVHVITNNFEKTEWLDERILVYPSGIVGPADKRDLGAQKSIGEILIFFDDDSYPASNILDIALPFFSDNSVVAIGGPAITPKEDSYWQKVSGAVFLSKFSGGAPERYLSIGSVKEVDDWPSVNFFVRKADFLKIGGFSNKFWPGEDTKLCHDLLLKTHKKILYVPQLIVWHHRRSGILQHLKQVGAYGLHRGYFAKVYPKTSRKIKYFAPSFIALIFAASVLLILMGDLIVLWVIPFWVLYLIVIGKAFLDIRRHESFSISIMSCVYIFFTHLWYGVRFVQGLMSPNLVSKLR